MKVLMSHPFSGALYAFFAVYNENRSREPLIKDTHPYYRTLYGDTFPQYQEMALTLTLLFDEVVIVPADAYLPKGYWKKDNTYQNPEIGLYTEWDLDVRRQLDDEIIEDLQDEEIQRILNRVPLFARKQILRDVRHEIHLAQKFKCPIICVGGRRSIINRIIQKRAPAPNTYSLSSLRMVEEYLRIAGPIFELRNIETLVDLKQDRDLRAYATSFTSAMQKFRDSTDVRSDLLRALQKAISSSRLANKITGFFDGTATVSSVVGLIPILGTITSAAGLGANVSAKIAKGRKRSQIWFELAGQIRRVASISQLEREIEKELTTASRSEQSNYEVNKNE